MSPSGGTLHFMSQETNKPFGRFKLNSLDLPTLTFINNEDFRNLPPLFGNPYYELYNHTKFNWFSGTKIWKPETITVNFKMADNLDAGNEDGNEVHGENNLLSYHSYLY